MKWTCLLAAWVCATAMLAPAQGADDSGVQSRIVALEKAWNQAYKAGDRRALDSILDKDIVLINDDGTVQTKAEFLAGITKAVSSQEQQVAPESMTVHVHGNVAIASGVFRAKGTEAGKSYVRRERFVDTWVYREGKWVCVATNATPVLH